MRQIEMPDALLKRRTHCLWDDFDWYITPHLWTSLAADSGATVACGTSTNTNGFMTLTTGATDNNEAAFATTSKNYLFAVDKPLLYEAAIQYAEAATNAANVCVGFSSVMNTANMILDNGSAPAASFSGAIIYKLDGGTVWRFRTSIGATNIDSVSQHTAGGAAYQTLRIELREAGTYLEAVPFLNGNQMLDANNLPIKHKFVTTSAATMQAGAYVKDGSGTGEVLTVDYIAANQLR